MVDSVTPELRSKIMSRVRSRDTGPELTVRRLVHAMGYRYRLHRRDLPGTPDLVFPGRRKLINVHGCFWHGHTCALGRIPKSRVEFWTQKIAKNRERDKRMEVAQTSAGWSVLTIWECELRDLQSLEERTRGFLDA